MESYDIDRSSNEVVDCGIWSLMVYYDRSKCRCHQDKLTKRKNDHYGLLHSSMCPDHCHPGWKAAAKEFNNQTKDDSFPKLMRDEEERGEEDSFLWAEEEQWTRVHMQCIHFGDWSLILNDMNMKSWSEDHFPPICQNDHAIYNVGISEKTKLLSH